METESSTGWTSARVFASGARVADRYRVEQFVAAGGMGEVYRVTDERLGVEVALKVLRAGAAVRIEEEVRHARKVTHPNVCRVFDLGVHHEGDAERPFITMELLDGAPLTTQVRAGLLRPSEIEPLAREVAAGLAAAHAAGVVHGDLKPGNVFRTRGGRHVVTDFGLARSSQAVHASTGGTPAYVAPEQVSGLPPTPASDVYALGVMLFQLSTGELPFTGATTEELVRRRLTEAPDLAKVPTRLRELVRACLSVDPAARPAAGAIASGTPASRDRRSLRWVSAIALLVAVVVLALLWPAPSVAEPRHVRLEVSANGEDREWLSSATADVARRALERTRWFRVDPTASDTVRVTVEGEVDRVKVELRAGTFSRTLLGPNVRVALETLSQELVNHHGGKVAPPSPYELGEMAKVGVTDPVVWRTCVDADEIYWEVIESDSVTAVRSLKAALARDPGWSLLWAKLVVMQGQSGVLARDELLAARKAVQPRRDPVGDDLLDAIEHLQRGDTRAAISLSRDAVNRSKSELVVAWVLFAALLREQRFDEAHALTVQLFEQHPELQLSGNLISDLQGLGRPEGVREVVQKAAAAAPGAKQTLITSLFVTAVLEPRLADRAMNRLFLLHGRTPANQFAVMEALVHLSRFAEARHVAKELATIDALQSSRSLVFASQMSIKEGRLGEAHDSLLAALEQGQPYGLESLQSQTLTMLARLARLDGRTGEERAHLMALAQSLREHGTSEIADVVAVQAALIASPDCTQVEALRGRVPQSTAELAARRQLLRGVVRFGCANCDEVVQAGLGPYEQSTEGLVVFARCAIDADQRVLARNALIRVVAAIPGTRLALDSPFDAVLAHYELGRLAEREGNRDEALEHYREVLAMWSASEVKVPELAASRSAVERLEAAR